MGIQYENAVVDETEKRDLRKPAEEVEKNSILSVLELLLAVIITSVAILPVSIICLFSWMFKKKKSVKNKLVIVTGAGRGIGRQLALKLARLGAKLACVDINKVNNMETVEMIKQEGGEAKGYVTNVGKLEEVQALKAQVETQMGPVDILVNNAALVMATCIDDWSEKEVRGFYDVNILSHYWMNMTFLPGMRKRNSGHILSMSSLSAFSPLPFLTLYAATKAAVSMFSDVLREELNLRKDNQIKVTTIHPYFINTSADYATFCKIKGMNILGEDSTSNIIIDALLYEEETIVIPRHMWSFVILEKLIPRMVRNMTLKLIRPKMTLPTKAVREILPYNQIIESTVKKVN